MERVGIAVGILLACADGDMVGSRDDNVGVSVGFPVVVADTDGTRLGSRVVLIVGFIVGAKVIENGKRRRAKAVSSSEKETDSSGNDVGSGRASSDDRGADVGLRGILVFSSLLDDDETLEED